MTVHRLPPRHDKLVASEEVASAIDAARAHDFDEVLIIGYRHGDPGEVTALYSMADRIWLEDLMREFRRDLAWRKYPDVEG